jgi:hypothetical protein
MGRRQGARSQVFTLVKDLEGIAHPGFLRDILIRQLLAC